MRESDRKVFSSLLLLFISILYTAHQHVMIEVEGTKKNEVNWKISTYAHVMFALKLSLEISELPPSHEHLFHMSHLSASNHFGMCVKNFSSSFIT